MTDPSQSNEARGGEIRPFLLDQDKMRRLWVSPNGYWHVLYGPRLTRRISARTKNQYEAEKFLADIMDMEKVGVLRERNTIKMVAEYWGCSTDHVRGLIKSGELTHLNLGGVIRITAEQVEECERQHIVEATRSDEQAARARKAMHDPYTMGRLIGARELSESAKKPRAKR